MLFYMRGTNAYKRDFMLMKGWERALIFETVRETGRQVGRQKKAKSNANFKTVI